MALQMARALSTYGAQGQIGQIVSITLVRELGPVLTAVLVAGRNASGIASELGSMKVTEQIDAMRALGTDPDSEAGHAPPDRHGRGAASAHHHCRLHGPDRRLL